MASESELGIKPVTSSELDQHIMRVLRNRVGKDERAAKQLSLIHI